MPERVFYTREELQNAWALSESDITQYLLHGSLVAHVWLPMMSVYEVLMEQEGNRIVCTKELRHWEGYTPLYSHQCRTLFRMEKVYLREFMCGDCNKKLILPETSESIRVGLTDMVIMNEERKRFELHHNFLSGSQCHVRIMGRIVGAPKLKESSYFEQDFRKVHHEGIDYRFGEIQASVVRQLYESALKGDPWQNGKQLLNNAGSSSFTMQNVFKSNVHWRKLIESDERGAYRIRPSFLTSVKEQ